MGDRAAIEDCLTDASDLGPITLPAGGCLPASAFGIGVALHVRRALCREPDLLTARPVVRNPAALIVEYQHSARSVGWRFALDGHALPAARARAAGRLYADITAGVLHGGVEAHVGFRRLRNRFTSRSISA